MMIFIKNDVLLIILIIMISSLINYSNEHQTTFREETENTDNNRDASLFSVHPKDNEDLAKENQSLFNALISSLLPKWISWRLDYVKSLIRQLRSSDISNLINEWMSLSTSEITGINIRSSLTCYNDLGCFPAERNCFSLLFGVQNSVYSLEKINTTFLIFQRSPNAINTDSKYAKDSTVYRGANYEDAKVISYVNMEKEIKNVSVSNSVHTFIGVHGFNSGYEASKWLPELKRLIFNYTNDNFIAVDWSGGADIFNYQRARANTRVVGAQIARFIQFLGTEFNISPLNITLIGHSLGAHIMGYAGKRFNQFSMNTNSNNSDNQDAQLETIKVSKILGLDPAGPCFGFNDTTYPVTERLHKTDARLVEVIHTNGIYGGEGIDIKLGHYDYFPNGGQVQPGCPAPLEVVLMPFRFKELSCSHVRAPELMNAVRKNSNDLYGSCQFVSYECKNHEKFLNGKCASCEDAKCQLMFVRKLTDAGTLINDNLIADPPPKEDDDEEEVKKINTIGSSYLGYLKRRQEDAKQSPSYFIETSEYYPYCLHHYQVIVELNESKDDKNNNSEEVKQKNVFNGTLSLTLTSKGETPRVGTVNITMTPSDGLGPFTGLMLINSINETNNDPGAFTRIAFKYFPKDEEKDKNIVVNIKNIRYNYMSDIRPEIRHRLSGSISTNQVYYSDKYLASNSDANYVASRSLRYFKKRKNV